MPAQVQVQVQAQAQSLIKARNRNIIVVNRKQKSNNADDTALSSSNIRNWVHDPILLVSSAYCI